METVLEIEFQKYLKNGHGESQNKMRVYLNQIILKMMK